MYKLIFKRLLDICLSIIGLIFSSPFFIIIYIYQLFINKGNPLFFQPRPGKNEKTFKIIKFKTMTDEKDENGSLLADKYRMTKFGSFLRQASLDEIPQLINILKGDMSIVGPRPLRVRYLPYYTKEESIRHTIRPGITGLAQVSGRNSLDWDEKLSKDIEYVKTLSLLNDIKIILKTAKKVLFKSDDDIELAPDLLDLDELRKNTMPSKDQ